METLVSNAAGRFADKLKCKKHTYLKSAKYYAEFYHDKGNPFLIIGGHYECVLKILERLTSKGAE